MSGVEIITDLALRGLGYAPEAQVIRFSTFILGTPLTNYTYILGTPLINYTYII